MADIDVLCVGLAVADVMGKPIDHVPEWDHLATFGHVEHHIGGCAVNTAVDVVRLGAKAGVCACLGNDGAGLFVRNSLDQAGVDAAGLVETDQAATSYTFVMIGSDGRRRYLHHVGANAHLKDTDIPDTLLNAAKLLHLGGTFLLPGFDGEPTARLLRRAKAGGLTTAMDTAYNPNVPCAELIAPCLPHLDIFVPSVEEAQAITGETTPEAMLAAIELPEGALLGIKLGPEGCILRTPGGAERIAAYGVDVSDGSGAGDAFMAGFLYATLQGQPPEAAARFGNATAAHCIQSIGCSAGVPPAEEVERFIERRKA